MSRSGCRRRRKTPPRAEVNRVCDARRVQILLGTAGDVPRIAGIRLARERVDDGKIHDQGLFDAERIHVGRRHVGNELHVRFVDGLESSYRRTVEHETLSEDVVFEGGDGNGEVRA